MIALIFLAAFGTLAISFWPYMIPFAIIIDEAAAPHASLVTTHAPIEVRTLQFSSLVALRRDRRWAVSLARGSGPKPEQDRRHHVE